MTWEVITGDCLEVMPTLGKVDAVITDPPYNENIASLGSTRAAYAGQIRSLDKGGADSLPVDVLTLGSALVRAVKQSIYVWCGTTQAGGLREIFRTLGLSTRLFVWEKTNPSPLNGDRLWLSSIEWGVFARRPKAHFAAPFQSPVWRGPIQREQEHPTQKPLWLIRKQVAASCLPGMTVLDPYCGSGTTGVACVERGVNFIGIEIDPGHADIARRRIDEASRQQRLF